MSNISCDFCGSTDYKEVYKPQGTKRNNRVCICEVCGLVFSIHDAIPYSREPNISGDADWGNVRFCKGQRFDVIRDMLPKDARYVLDVGSSRGHFVTWARRAMPNAEITAVEPDTRVIDSYADEFNVIGKKLEDIALPDNHFDFVYCMQTLEHVDSASAMLKQIYKALAPGGTLFLEVPNIEAFRFPLNVEESFIDKHNFHFSKGVLCNYMMKLGYDVKVNADDLNVRVVAKKQDMQVRPVFKDSDPYKLMNEYSANITRNRAKLPAVVERVTEMMAHTKVAFFGANVLFDLMVKYGGLDASKVECLMDDYINGLVDNLHGVPIQSSDYLRVYHPDTCIILARHSADAVAAKARKFGVRNVVKFYDLLRSV